MPGFCIASIAILRRSRRASVSFRFPPWRGAISTSGTSQSCFTALTFGPFSAALAGGLGTALADLLSGPFAFWAPISLVVHGLQGLIVGLIAAARPQSIVVRIVAGVVGMAIVAGGYFVAGGFITGWGPSLVDVPANLLQGGVGVVLASSWHCRCACLSAGEAMNGRALPAAIAAIRDRIGAAARRAGRQPSDIRLMAVTQELPRGDGSSARAAGLALFGENRVQEAELKYAGILPRPESI